MSSNSKSGSRQGKERDSTVLDFCIKFNVLLCEVCLGLRNSFPLDQNSQFVYLLSTASQGEWVRDPWNISHVFCAPNWKSILAHETLERKECWNFDLIPLLLGNSEVLSNSGLNLAFPPH